VEEVVLHWVECALCFSDDDIRTPDSFYDWVWSELSDLGVQGIEEGTVLSQDLYGPEGSDGSWPLDCGEAPSDRDWVSKIKNPVVKIFFETMDGAKEAILRIRQHWGFFSSYHSEKNQDWDAQWKNAFQGVAVDPYWFIRPPHRDLKEVQLTMGPNTKIITINPGAGFGTGTHETTQLILRILAERSSRFIGARALDFGSGSGILSIACGILGASCVHAVEIDRLANLNAYENIRLNGLESTIEVFEVLQDLEYDVIVANILRPVLVDFAEELIRRLKPGGMLVLSGLLEADLSYIDQAYSRLGTPERFQNGDWWAVLYET
jgi:ribosomal protein L11 methyltransferase